ncbi:hypothetical protein SCHPADRAFT_942277 [Schizopora paradoxa]|uniref:Uncharacterized protein n=1 Tax=Schizopora paradoxa TaxID=27342 RepID=A0A0H2RP22_9AGAM|nr:hypothetical protein SCHPADRAFT_942277 [Schizopora paradoxa]
MSLLNACLERSRDLPLIVVLRVYVDFLTGFSFDDVFEAAKPHAHRWRSVHFHFVHISHGILDYIAGTVGAQRDLDELKDISTPTLEHLALYSEPMLVGLSQRFIASLIQPKLRSLVAVFCFPSNIPPESFQAITSLEMTFTLRLKDFFDALALIQGSKMPNLTDLSLIFNQDERFWLLNPLPVPPLQITSISSVQRLRISTSTTTHRDLYSDDLEKDIFRALSFPNTRELSITFVGTPDPCFDLFDAVDRIFDQGEDYAIITDVNLPQFPCVSRLFIDVFPSGPEPEELAKGFTDLPLPLHLLPSLRELCIRSNMILELRTNYDENSEAPAIRRMEFDVPKSKTSLSTDSASPYSETPEVWEWVRALADAMTAQGVWNVFEELVLIERDYGAQSLRLGVNNNMKRAFSRDMLDPLFEKFDAEKMAKSRRFLVIMNDQTLAHDLELGWLGDVSDYNKPMLQYWRFAAIQSESRQREQRARELPFTLKLSFDTLLDIFTMILPSSSSSEDSNSSMDEEASRQFFETEAPYNISRVCRYWREFVFASPSLWSRFALSFQNPSNRTFKKAILYISLHLQKSQDLPLSCAISLKGRVDGHNTMRLLDELAIHQRRWREIEFRFDEFQPEEFYNGFNDNEVDHSNGADEADDRYRQIQHITENMDPDTADMFYHTLGMENYLLQDVPPPPAPPVPVSTISLFTEELDELESLTLNQVSLFNLRATNEIAEPGLIPSLRRISLEMIDRFDKLVLWLERVPNIEELNLTFRSSDPLWARKKEQQDSLHIPNLHFEQLRVININHGLNSKVESDELMFAAGAGAFVTRFLVCPSLARFSIKLEGDHCIHHLHGFLLRSSPPLQSLDLHIVDRPSNGDPGQIMLVTRIIEALAILPSLMVFRLTSRAIDTVGLLLEALQSRTLLPSLERIEFVFACAQPSQFVDLVRSRCSSPRKVLKSLVLDQCLSRRYGPRLPLFGPNGDPSNLPREWAGLKDFIEEGLRFDAI